MNIMNVDVLSEIMVTVGGERCTIDLGITDTVRNIAQPGAQTLFLPISPSRFYPVSLLKASPLPLRNDRHLLVARYDLEFMLY